jgi:DNA-binding transcriptional LysR family regulator
MDLRRLAFFVTLAEELHFRRAADRCHMTQPALSQQLRTLEDELQVQLMHRNRRQVALTRAGEVFLGEARKLLSQAEQAAELTRRSARGEVGQHLPGVALVVREMTTAEQEAALRAGQIQVGIIHPPLDDPSLACEQFATVPFKLVLSQDNPLARRRTLRMADLGNENFITFPRQIGPRLYDRIIALCQEAGFSPRIILEASPAQSIVALAAAGYGVGWIASRHQQFPRAGVVYRRLVGPGPQLTLGVAYDARNAPPELQSFVATAKLTGQGIRD